MTWCRLRIHGHERRATWVAGAFCKRSTMNLLWVPWMIITGLGVSFAMMPAMDNALAALPRGREGTGTGLLTTLRQAGGAIGVALLGSMLNAVFTVRIDTDGVSAVEAEAAKESVVAASWWAP
jgi:hypothetical protein